MSNKLSSKEIAARYGVSERTAFRWLADDDHRCYEYERSQADDKSEKLGELKARLETLFSAILDVDRWTNHNAVAEADEIKKYRAGLYRLLVACCRASKQYTEQYLIEWHGRGINHKLLPCPMCAINNGLPDPLPEEDEEDDDQEAEPTPEPDTANVPTTEGLS